MKLGGTMELELISDNEISSKLCNLLQKDGYKDFYDSQELADAFNELRDLVKEYWNRSK